MRGLIWILAIALAGLAALWFAHRLGEKTSRGAVAPAAAPAVESAPLAEPTGAAREVELAPPIDPGHDLLPEALREPSAPPVVAGFEEGPATGAGRPLPDFGTRYAGFGRDARAQAMRDLAESIRTRFEALSAAAREDLLGRLAGRPPEEPPAAPVAELLAELDERAWLMRHPGRVEGPRD